MNISTSPFFSLYVGTASDRLYPDDYLSLGDVSAQALVSHPLFERAAQSMSLNALVFLRQTHSVVGYTINERARSTMHAFFHEGDFLITNQPGVGIGVMTADCLPIVVYDARNHVTGIAHAGWRGTVAGVAPKMLALMAQEYGTEAVDLQIFFAPSAHACCYQVQPDFIGQLNPAYVDAVIVRRDDNLFFDASTYNKIMMQEWGVNTQAFNHAYATCTICENRFFSFRREGQRAGRQMTIVALK